MMGLRSADPKCQLQKHPLAHHRRGMDWRANQVKEGNGNQLPAGAMRKLLTGFPAMLPVPQFAVKLSLIFAVDKPGEVHSGSEGG